MNRAVCREMQEVRGLTLGREGPQSREWQPTLVFLSEIPWTEYSLQKL